MIPLTKRPKCTEFPDRECPPECEHGIAGPCALGTCKKSLQVQDAPHGWIWLDDDGWEHDPDPQHPQERGEAEYGTDFRPATAEDAASDEFFRCPKIIISMAGA